MVIYTRKGNKMTKSIYVACPYSDSDKKVEEERTLISEAYTAYLIKNYGLIVVNPISNHWLAVRHDVIGTADYWWETNKFYLDVVDEMHVLMVDGFDSSIGIKLEIEYCTKKDIPFKYIEPGKYL
jgi:hypothetical protein